MSYYDKAKDLYDMLGQGQANEALEKHYAENVQIQEMPTGEQRSGKDAQRNALKGWFDQIKEHHGGGYNKITSNEAERTTMVENWTDVTLQNGHRMKMEQISVQQWNEDGQIEREQFFYQAGPPPQQS